MKSEELRRRFLDFFKARGHAIVPSSPLIPDDPSVLLTTAGMQQFKPYFVGKADPVKDFGSKNTASIQKSFRTSDIDMVGDESHLTFFEMMGNFSFGGYFKKEAIQYGYDFIVKELGLKIDYVSVFGGDPSTSSGQDNGVPADTESEKIWKSLGVTDVRKAGREDNFWGPTGAEGPCGPTTEIYVRGVEIWNIVFNEYYCNPDKSLRKLDVPGVDTGMGLERLAMVMQNAPTIFETDLFQKPFKTLALRDKDERIIADHLRATIFLLADGVRPSNKEAGYILRRILRRLLLHSIRRALRIESLRNIIKQAIEFYGDFYPELKATQRDILSEFVRENDRFDYTLGEGLKEFNKKFPQPSFLTEADRFAGGKQEFATGKNKISGKFAFNLYQSYGYPYEVTRDIAQERGLIVDEGIFRKQFEESFENHVEISRAGQERKFGGHGLLLDTGELKAGNEEELKKVTRLHTATHLLQQALRDVLGNEVTQMGSDITVERTRFDFTFPRKLTDEEKKKVEEKVNEIIKKDLPVSYKEMPQEEAKKTGALYFFKEKYPDKVKVYFVGTSLETAYSKEFCGGPHVTHTGEIQKFKILKEEAVGAGVRRIRATVEP